MPNFPFSVPKSPIASKAVTISSFVYTLSPTTMPDCGMTSSAASTSPIRPSTTYLSAIIRSLLSSVLSLLISLRRASSSGSVLILSDIFFIFALKTSSSGISARPNSTRLSSISWNTARLSFKAEISLPSMNESPFTSAFCITEMVVSTSFRNARSAFVTFSSLSISRHTSNWLRLPSPLKSSACSSVVMYPLPSGSSICISSWSITLSRFTSQRLRRTCASMMLFTSRPSASLIFPSLLISYLVSTGFVTTKFSIVTVDSTWLVLSISNRSTWLAPSAVISVMIDALESIVSVVPSENLST